MDGKRNTVLVTIDGLRADRCGYIDGDRDTTPTLDRLADEGLTFEQAIAPGPTTSNSMLPSTTGEFSISREGDPARGMSTERIRKHLRGRETIAERFAEMGYETGGFTANPWTSRFFEFDQGFDHFEDFIDADSSSSAFDDTDEGSNSIVAAMVRNVANWREGQNMFMQWEAFHDEVLAWKREASEPAFLWIFLVDPHMPYLPPSEYRSGSKLKNLAANVWLLSSKYEPVAPFVHDTLSTAYDDCIRYTDAFLRRLHDDLADDTLLAIHADHGEEFGDHGSYGHGTNLREEVLHVPLVVANGPTDTVEHPVSLRRLPDLLTDLASGDDPRETGTLDPTPYVRSRNWDPKYALRGDAWKYVREATDDALYDIDRDEAPMENAELVDLGRQLVRRWRCSDGERKRIANAVAETIGNERA